MRQNEIDTEKDLFLKRDDITNDDLLEIKKLFNDYPKGMEVLENIMLKERNEWAYIACSVMENEDNRSRARSLVNAYLYLLSEFEKARKLSKAEQ